MADIREARIEDIPGMARVYVQSWQKAYRGILPDDYLDGLDMSRWSVSYAQTLGKPGSPRAAVLLEGDKVIGVSSFARTRDEDLDKTWGELISLYLLQEYWGKGLGTALLGWVTGELRREGFEQCALWVLRDNLRARRLYERTNFRQDGMRKDIEIGGVVLSELRYTKPL